LLSAFTFFNTANRTDFSVLDRFIVASDATRKTGNAVADFLKGSLTSSSSLTAPIFDRSPVDDDALFFDLYFDITGTDGNDTLIGGDEKNSIVGGAGNDIITTGGGKNILKFGENSGSDVITDFQTDNDLIQIESSLGFADANAILAAVTYDGLTAELVLSEGNTLTIEVDRPLTNDNFLVV
jgi:Ca2+-binding RTX toxin-like protein